MKNPVHSTTTVPSASQSSSDSSERQPPDGPRREEAIVDGAGPSTVIRSVESVVIVDQRQVDVRTVARPRHADRLLPLSVNRKRSSGSVAGYGCPAESRGGGREESRPNRPGLSFKHLWA